MACGCKQAISAKRPETPCLQCAHKHAAAARCLYELEPGYEDVNKSDAIGQLILAAWHLQKEHFPLAEKCRDARHAIESGEPAGAALRELQEILWNQVIQSNKHKEQKQA